MSAHAQPRLVTKQEAADYLRVSLRTFDRHVAPRIETVRIGGRVFYTWEELNRWLDAQTVGPLSQTSGRGIGSYASDTTAVGTNGPRAKRIIERLKKRRSDSTPRLYPVGGDGPRTRARKRSTR